MKTFIAIETTDSLCSVALLHQDNILTLQEQTHQKHNQKLMSLIHQILTESAVNAHAIDAIIFGKGPGSFTGARIAAATAQGLATAWQRPVIPVSSLEALAQQAVRSHQAKKIISAIDARMHEIYWAAFAYDEVTQHLTSLKPEILSSPHQLNHILSTDQWFGIGTGWNYHEQLPILPKTFDAQAKPLAQDMIQLAISSQYPLLEPHQALPTYIRNNIAQPKQQ
ncbi:MAG: tRNA (adenosine(37)-N6)-threonylcarbamoyltransferase complex dimerization subunit type 1 TsaB [Endozoicomonadaceae bacterium]|nr:tRNA (adenosine(37)-N6)-threonylcarbamoyltransferase complex dimerization subunit type 1 TsaB [Endozoicomonadaceae bacterium]